MMLFKLIFTSCIICLSYSQFIMQTESVQCLERGCNSSLIPIQSSSIYTAIMLTSNLTNTVDNQASAICTFYYSPSMKIHSSFNITRNNITTIHCSGNNYVYSIQNDTTYNYELPYYCYEFKVTSILVGSCQLFSNDLSGFIQFRVPTLSYLYNIIFLP